MSKGSFALAVFFLLLALCIGHALYYYPQLPEQVATHFNAAGEPDDWSSKSSFLTFYFVVAGIMAFMFLGIAVALPKIPPDLVNLPHRDYWLAPERREGSCAFMFSYLLWFGSATLLFFIDLAHQSFRVHLGRAERLEHVWLSLGIYLAFTIAWSIGLYVRFSRPPQA